MKLIRKIAQKDGIIILTDSDSAGAVIRGHLCSCINPEYITNVFVPCIKGKEKRKREESKEGYLGVANRSFRSITTCQPYRRKYLSPEKGSDITHALIGFCLILVLFIISGYLEGLERWTL